MKSTRVIVIAVALTMVATFYSLSELHRLGIVHEEANKDKRFGIDTVPAVAAAPAASTPSKTGAPLAGVPSQKPEGKVKSVTIEMPAVVATTTTTTTPAVGGRKCYQYEHTELWGDVVGWGTTNLLNSPGECCQQCLNYKPQNADDTGCNVWVYCGDKASCGSQYKQCWLKHLPHPEASKPARQGPTVPWTSGTTDVDLNADPSLDPKAAKAKADKKGPPRLFHIVTTAQGSAVHWQVRVHYYWYKKVKAQCEKEGACEMGGFTRLLHSGTPDDLMDELPTVVVDPLPTSMVEHSWYIVLNRPYAFVQWVSRVNIPERFVLMSEPDHVFLRPLPNFMDGNTPAAFPFFYIEPGKQEHLHITRRFAGATITKKQIEQIAPVGNSPTFMTWEDMKKVMPTWMNVSIAIFKDQEANSVWGWVQEMYGFTIAAFLQGITHVDLFLHLMAQPPWDTEMQMAPSKPFYILHYTYGMDYKLSGEFTPGKFGEWRFDKRTYSGRPPPRHLGEPPKNMKNDLVRRLIDSINEASAALPCWDSYHTSGSADYSCPEMATMTDPRFKKDGKQITETDARP